MSEVHYHEGSISIQITHVIKLDAAKSNGFAHPIAKTDATLADWRIVMHCFQVNLPVDRILPWQKSKLNLTKANKRMQKKLMRNCIVQRLSDPNRFYGVVQTIWTLSFCFAFDWLLQGMHIACDSKICNAAIQLCICKRHCENRRRYNGPFSLW